MPEQHTNTQGQEITGRADIIKEAVRMLKSKRGLFRKFLKCGTE